MRTLLSFLLASSMILVAQPDGREIVRRSLSAAHRNLQARQSYTYTARNEERHLDAQGRVKFTDVDVSKAVLANGDTIEQTVSHNGGPPTAAKRKKDEENLRKRRSETSLERGARLREEKENRAFIDEIPDAFNFRLIGEQVIRGRPAYTVELTSRPEFHARSKYGTMFSKVTGKIWVDREDFGWVKVDVDVAEPFSIGSLHGSSAAGIAHSVRADAFGRWHLAARSYRDKSKCQNPISKELRNVRGDYVFGVPACSANAGG